MPRRKSSDGTSLPLDEHPTTEPLHNEQLSDHDDTATIYFDANSWPSTPFHQHAIDLKRELAKVHKGRTKVMELFSSQDTLPSPEPLEKRLEQLEVSFILVTVMNYIGSSNYSQARKEAREALKIAQGIDNEILIARSYYWMGRIEFELRNYTTAYAHFKAARPCVMDEVYPEGQSVGFYLGISRSGVGEEYRKRALLEQNRAILEAAAEQDPSDLRVVVKSKKRKRGMKTWELVLRPASDRLSRGQQRYAPGKSKPKQGREKSPVWMVHDTSDLPQHRETSLNSRDGISHSHGMELLKRPQSHRPLEWHPFTFRCYPLGLAPRTRPTNIFPPQPCEHILTAEEWEFLQKRTKGRAISMGYLAREREMVEEIKKRQGAKIPGKK